jgi:hypothetical protein
MKHKKWQECHAIINCVLILKNLKQLIMILLIQKIKRILINAKVAKVLWVTFIKYLNSNHN